MARRSAVQVGVTGYGLVVGLAIVTLALVLIHQGRLLNFGFPLVATMVAAALFNTRRSVYAAFVWWIWLFTPLVRRLVDYQTTYHNVSPVILTPLLVTGFAFAAVARRPRVLLRRSMLPYLLIVAVIVYAAIVGAVTNTPLAALYDMANWLVPLAFALFLTMYPAEFDEMRAALVFAIILGLLVISLYGLYQFYSFPPWDAYWLTASKFSAAGLGSAEQVRLWGTLNSPGPYAIVLMASLVFVLVAKGRLRVLAGGFGFPAFALSLVRSSWGGFLLAGMFIIWRVGGKTRLRILAIGSVVAVVAVPLLAAGPIADVVSKRFDTFSDIRQDQSFHARRELYETFAVTAFSQPVGVGLGGIGNAAKLVNGQTVNFDSGVLQIPYQFGWAGGAVFLWAIAAMLRRVLKTTRQSNDRIGIAGGAVFVAMLAQNLFASTFPGVLGLAMWMGVALAVGPALTQGLAARRRPETMLRVSKLPSLATK